MPAANHQSSSASNSNRPSNIYQVTELRRALKMKTSRGRRAQADVKITSRKLDMATNLWANRARK
jgi:hypothetical protein